MSEELQVEVTRTYLEMNSRAEFIPAFCETTRARIEQVHNCPASFYRYLYAEVGRFYHWVDRLDWSDEEIYAHLRQSGLALWVMYDEGAPAGYFELLRGEDGSTEIAYFGLLPEFIGKGLGKHLLSVAIDEAWKAGARRVWLHTCSLDGPAALPNYLKRGFKPFKRETYFTAVSYEEEQRGRWPKP
jgi:GNAT superfamily N-acetyltransferase